MADSYRPTRRPPPRQGPPGSHAHPPTSYRDDDSRRPQQPPAFQFTGGQDSYRRDGQSGRPGRNGPPDDRNGGRDTEFSFRSQAQGPRFPPSNNRPSYNLRSSSPPRGPRSMPGRGRARTQRDFAAQRRRALNGPPAAHDRAILGYKREPTPEQLEGMGDGKSRFVDIDALTDDSSEDMSLDDDDEEANGEGDYKAAKRARTDAGKADGDSAPKWSNPDPYTALPPPDLGTGKRKDVVKLIRKAKVATTAEDVAAAKSKAAKTAVAENADFISLNFEEHSSDEEYIPDSGEVSEEYSPKLGVTELKNAGQNGPASSNQDVQSPPTVQLPSPVVADQHWRPAEWGQQPADLRGQQRPQHNRPTTAAAGHKRKRGPGLITGNITQEWASHDPLTSTPWNVIDHSVTENMGFWLHKEICDFYEWSRPEPDEVELRLGIISRIERVAIRYFSYCRVESFGSFASRLFLPTSDMDLVVISDDFRRTGRPMIDQSYRALRKFASQLVHAGIASEHSMEIIARAKVPIIKLVDRTTMIKVDISFENMTGVVANQTFKEWKAQFPGMPRLVMLVKQFLAMRDLNEVYLGGVGGFTITCLVVSFLQHLPEVQSGNMEIRQHLGDLFMMFLDLYGNKFNRVTTGIEMKPPRYFPKPAAANDRLSIIDPNKPDNDISVGSSKIDLVQNVFSDAHKALHEKMVDLSRLAPSERQGVSILGCVMAGNYSSFARAREHLKRLHDDMHGAKRQPVGNSNRGNSRPNGRGRAVGGAAGGQRWN